MIVLGVLFFNKIIGFENEPKHDHDLKAERQLSYITSTSAYSELSTDISISSPEI